MSQALLRATLTPSSVLEAFGTIPPTRTLDRVPVCNAGLDTLEVSADVSGLEIWRVGHVTALLPKIASHYLPE